MTIVPHCCDTGQRPTKLGNNLHNQDGALMDNDLLSRPHISRAEVMALLGIGPTTLWQLQKAGVSCR